MSPECDHYSAKWEQIKRVGRAISGCEEVLCYWFVFLKLDSNHCSTFRLRRNSRDNNTTKQRFSHHDVREIDSCTQPKQDFRVLPSAQKALKPEFLQSNR